MPDEDTASSTPQPAYKTGIAISLLFLENRTENDEPLTMSDVMIDKIFKS